MRNLLLLSLAPAIAALAALGLLSCAGNGDKSGEDTISWGDNPYAELVSDVPSAMDSLPPMEMSEPSLPEEEYNDLENHEEDYDDNYGDDSPSDSYATPSRYTWTGASSVEELRQKLDGTYWHTDPSATKKDRLFIYELHFSNGKISMKTYTNAKANERPTDKKWVGGDDEFVYPSYKINYHSRGDFISVYFGQEEDLKLEYRSFSICFMENCRIATLFHFGEPDGLLKFGRFNPNK